ncbi:hypothetical protein ACFV4N_32935 [Actinosynnema sp. NPDC059797]
MPFSVTPATWSQAAKAASGVVLPEPYRTCVAEIAAYLPRL